MTFENHDGPHEDYGLLRRDNTQFGKQLQTFRSHVIHEDKQIFRVSFGLKGINLAIFHIL
jgi:hypothetical protein